jgi:hypothetical protein
LKQTIAMRLNEKTKRRCHVCSCSLAQAYRAEYRRFESTQAQIPWTVLFGKHSQSRWPKDKCTESSADRAFLRSAISAKEPVQQCLHVHNRELSWFRSRARRVRLGLTLTVPIKLFKDTFSCPTFRPRETNSYRGSSNVTASLRMQPPTC